MAAPQDSSQISEGFKTPPPYQIGNTSQAEDSGTATQRTGADMNDEMGDETEREGAKQSSEQSGSARDSDDDNEPSPAGQELLDSAKKRAWKRSQEKMATQNEKEVEREQKRAKKIHGKASSSGTPRALKRNKDGTRWQPGNPEPEDQPSPPPRSPTALPSEEDFEENGRDVESEGQGPETQQRKKRGKQWKGFGGRRRSRKVTTKKARPGPGGLPVPPRKKPRFKSGSKSGVVGKSGRQRR